MIFSYWAGKERQLLKELHRTNGKVYDSMKEQDLKETHRTMDQNVAIAQRAIASNVVTATRVKALIDDTARLSKKSQAMRKVREIGLDYTWWWYSLCNFQYRPQYENTCSDHFDG